jgi:iron complex transport system substrate-binding protein
MNTGELPDDKKLPYRFFIRDHLCVREANLWSNTGMKIFSFLLPVVLFFAGSAFAAAPPRRIITLAPNMTEIVYALGLGENVVGVTTFCDYPEDAKKKPKVGGMSNPSLEAVVSLKPDLVVMTTDGNPKEFQERLGSLRIRTYVFEARRLNELPKGIRDLGRALGIPERGESLARGIEQGLRQASGRWNGKDKPHRKVLFIVWPEPLIVAGPNTVIDDAFALLGQANVAAAAKTEYPKYSLEEVIRQAPDVLFIGKSMGMDMREVSGGALDRMQSVPAVRNGNVFFLSDRLLRLGPRVLKGIEEMATDLEQAKVQ